MTCGVIGQAVQCDFMRYFGDGHLACDLGSIARSRSPFNEDFAVVDSDQPVDVHPDWSRETLTHEHDTYFDLRCPSSASPSSHEVEVTQMFSPPSP